jgi:hypothetical protein
LTEISSEPIRTVTDEWLSTVNTYTTIITWITAGTGSRWYIYKLTCKSLLLIVVHNMLWLGCCTRMGLSEQYLRPLGFIAPMHFWMFWLSNLSISSVVEGYSRNASCALNLISTFLLFSSHWERGPRCEKRRKPHVEQNK